MFQTHWFSWLLAIDVWMLTIVSKKPLKISWLTRVIVLEMGIAYGESFTNILRMKNHPFQVCHFSSSFFAQINLANARTKKPKLSLWFFFICTRDGNCLRRVMFEHFEIGKPIPKWWFFIPQAFIQMNLKKLSKQKTQSNCFGFSNHLYSRRDLNPYGLMSIGF